MSSIKRRNRILKAIKNYQLEEKCIIEGLYRKDVAYDETRIKHLVFKPRLVEKGTVIK